MILDVTGGFCGDFLDVKGGYQSTGVKILKKSPGPEK